MNPWILLAVVLLWGASVSSAGWFGYGAGRDSEIANRVENEEIARVAREAAQQGAADEIAKIKPVHTTIRQTLHRELQTSVVYRDCRHTPDGLRALNQALTGRVDAVAESGLRTDAGARGRLVRSNDKHAGRSRDAAPRMPEGPGHPR